MGELDDILKQEAAKPEKPEVATITVTVVNPTDREMRRLRVYANTVNSYKAPGLGRAKIVVANRESLSVLRCDHGVDRSKVYCPPCGHDPSDPPQRNPDD